MSLIELPNTFQPWKKQAFLRKGLDPNIISWLLDSGSLTRRIIKFCTQHNSQFQVEVLNQEIALPTLSEQQRLSIKIRQWAYIREVLLYCGQTPVVYARTVIPLGTLTGKQRQLAFLGNRPLGAFLFSQRKMRRDPLEISRLKHKQNNLWARRSAFYLDNKPLLVYEVFLSGLFQDCKQ